MMGTRIHTEQLTIEHVRDRGQRMPVLGMNVGKRPADTVPGQASTHMRIVEHVKRIVIINELMPKRLSEHRPRDHEQKDDDPEQCPARWFGVEDLGLQSAHRFSKCNFASSGWPFCNKASPKKRSASG